MTNDKLRLECNLTSDELLEYGRLLSETIVEKNRADSTLASFQRQQKATIAALEAKVALFSDKINTRREYRDIDCVVLYDWDANKVTWTRKDTGEVVKERKIEDDERQEAMNLA